VAFKKGQSGNAKGRTKGAVSERTRFYNMVKDQGEEIISAVIEQAKMGQPIAMRLCYESLVAKIKYTSVDIDLPKKIKSENMEEIKLKLAQAVLDGKMGAADAKIVQDMLMDNPDAQEPKEVDVSTITDEEAESMYKDVMNGKV